MFSLIIFFIVAAVICVFAVIYARAGKVRQKHIAEAEKRRDIKEAKRLSDMSDDEAADEFEDELYK